LRALSVRIAQGWILLALFIGSCSLQPPSATPSLLSPAAPSVAPSLFPDTPTPTPLLVLVGEADEALAQALTQWSSQRGWGLTSYPDETTSPERLALPQGARALVSMTGLDMASLIAARPDMIAVVVDQETMTSGPRVSTVGMPSARRDQAGFLAGVLAGLVDGAETLHVVSGTGGEWDGVYLAAFDHGVRYSCPKCAVTELQAEALASSATGQRTEVLFVIPGPAAADTANEAIGLGARWIIWVGEGAEGIDPSRVAGQVMFVREELVVQALEALLNGEAGTPWPYTVENSGIRFTDIHPEAISPGRLRWAEEAYDQLVSGDLDPGVDPMTGAGP